MLKQIKMCDICGKNETKVNTYILPVYGIVSVEGGWKERSSQKITFSGNISQQKIDLCDKCAMKELAKQCTLVSKGFTKSQARDPIYSLTFECDGKTTISGNGYEIKFRGDYDI